MPSHPTRWAHLALALLFLFTAVAQPAFARPGVELYEDCEGDPGDGVLDPAQVASGWKPGAAATVSDADGVDRPVYLLPIVLLPGSAPVAVIMISPVEGRFGALPWRLIPAGRWHDAR